MSPRWGDMSREERFRSHLRLAENGCLEWTACRLSKGYGVTYLVAGEQRAHRAAWVLAHGPIPAGLQVLHHCDNPPCCKTEPDDRYPEGHLFLGTNAANKADFAVKGRGKGQRRPWQTGNNHWARRHPEWVHRGARDPDRTHCKRGHPVSADRDIIRASGSITCRKCHNENRRNLRHQRRTALCRPS